MSPSAAATDSPQARTPSWVLIALIAVIIAALAGLDKSLAALEGAEVRNVAQTAYEKGTRHLRAGSLNEAIDELRNAHAMVRTNASYELQLANALLADDKAAEAEPLIDELLERDANDGATNLTAARLASRERDVSGAEAYYHRAIYGEWPSDEIRNRTTARLELINYLDLHGSREALLSELISLEAEGVKDAGVEKRIAGLFLKAGSPARAAAVYESLIAQNHGDADAYAGLGQARMEEGQYRAAHTAFEQAIERSPNDKNVETQLEVLKPVTAFDPTPRWLTSMEKYRRSLKILQMVREDLGQCSKENDTAAQRLIADADRVLSGKTAKIVTNEMSEQILLLAENGWRERLRTCGSAAGSEQEALRILMSRLAS